MDGVLIVVGVLGIIVGLAVLCLVWKILAKMAAFTQKDVETAVRQEMRAGREEAAASAKALREEVGKLQNQAIQIIVNTLRELGKIQKERLEEVDKAMKSLAETSQQNAISLREEIAKTQKAANDSLIETIGKMGEAQKTALGEVVKSVEQIVQTNRTEIASLKEDVKKNQNEVNESLVNLLNNLGNTQKERLGEVTKSINELINSSKQESNVLREKIDAKFKDIQTSNEQKLEQMRKTIDEKLHSMLEKRLADVVTGMNQVIDRNRNEIASLKEDVKKTQKEVNESLTALMNNLGNNQKEKLGEVTKSINELIASIKLESNVLREKLDVKFKDIQTSNEQKLEEMRKTVDEKLQSTLEKRLGESFKIVSERLEAVHRGLGEMQNLATGVGDLKRVLTNVKARGTWGEVQLRAILEQILTPEQYSANVATKEDSRERVEFAVCLPGKNGDDCPVWLPIDAKFPKEDYDRLVNASAAGDSEGVVQASDALIREIERCAKDISDKHVNPPMTTDFAIMFLPTEGLYAEVLRQPGMQEMLQRKYRIVAAGPTTLAAVLNSLRMGFHTLAIEKRSSEVWRILGAVKTEFGKFGEIIDKVKGQLETATRTLDTTGARTRSMSRKLSDVSALPQTEAEALLRLGEIAHDNDEQAA